MSVTYGASPLETAALEFDTANYSLLSRSRPNTGDNRKIRRISQRHRSIAASDPERFPETRPADLCDYALLRRENPVASKSKYGIDQAFNILQPVLNTSASNKDPEGIVRY